MKYIIVLADGMAGQPLEELNGKTTLEYASTPFMDELAGKGTIGLVKTVPAGMKPGSDVANLSVIGYDPNRFYSGRSPLEALSVGVQMKRTDVVLRCNIVTLSEDEPYAEKTILDTVSRHAGHPAIKSRNMTKSSLDLIIELRTADGSQLVRDVLNIASVHSASLMSHDGEVTF